MFLSLLSKWELGSLFPLRQVKAEVETDADFLFFQTSISLSTGENGKGKPRNVSRSRNTILENGIPFSNFLFSFRQWGKLNWSASHKPTCADWLLFIAVLYNVTIFFFFFWKLQTHNFLHLSYRPVLSGAEYFTARDKYSSFRASPEQIVKLAPHCEPSWVFWDKKKQTKKTKRWLKIYFVTSSQTLLTSPFFCLFRGGINTHKPSRLSEPVFDNFLHRVWLQSKQFWKKNSKKPLIKSIPEVQPEGDNINLCSGNGA